MPWQTIFYGSLLKGIKVGCYQKHRAFAQKGEGPRHPLLIVVARSVPRYTAKTNLKLKVLDSVQLGGPFFTIDRTVFEMWLGSL